MVLVVRDLLDVQIGHFGNLVLYALIAQEFVNVDVPSPALRYMHMLPFAPWTLFGEGKGAPLFCTHCLFSASGFRTRSSVSGTTQPTVTQISY